MTATGESKKCSRRISFWETKMTDPKSEASKLFKQGQPTLSEYDREQLAIQKNLARLKAERLAREAQRG
jgi:hypothetical protein